MNCLNYCNKALLHYSEQSTVSQIVVATVRGTVRSNYYMFFSKFTVPNHLIIFKTKVLLPQVYVTLVGGCDHLVIGFTTYAIKCLSPLML
jgi:hypothetical protein